MARIAIHPGEHLSEELDALKMSAAKLARRLRVPTNRVTAILNGQRAITGDTALRLPHFFGTSAEFWLNLQNLYELRLAEAKTGKAIKPGFPIWLWYVYPSDQSSRLDFAGFARGTPPEWVTPCG